MYILEYGVGPIWLRLFIGGREVEGPIHSPILYPNTSAQRGIYPVVTHKIFYVGSAY